MPKLVVGIGGSAGALDAFESIFRQLPQKLGLAYVVLLHLDPAHKSLLPELLGKMTLLPVRSIEEGMTIEADHVYVGPPGRLVQVQSGAFRLAEIGPLGNRLHPIDRFFGSLADAFRHRAVGIVVSGTGTDGTAGLEAIRLAGGTAVCQAPDEASFDGMPRSALQARVVDQVIGAAGIPRLLASMAEAFGIPSLLSLSLENDEVVRLLERVFEILLRKTGHDFSGYKRTTLLRRIERRLAAHGLSGLQDYVQVLESDPSEPQALLKDLLISVTRFFRDPEAFGILKNEVVPQLFARGAASDAVRAWVPACATGEEAYSIAMLLSEHRMGRANSREIQVFATDIDCEALEQARLGKYPPGIREEVPAELLARYFRPVDGGYQVTEELRSLCVFSEHDLIKDPPFSRMDLVSCRNLFIYWEADLQKRVIPLFHYALSRDGFLFLGPAENIGATEELFRVVDKKHRVFQRLEVAVRPSISLPFAAAQRSLSARNELSEQLHAPGERELGRVIAASLLDHHAPPAVVVNERGDIVFVSGRTGRFLEATTGSPTHNLFELIRKPIRPEVHSLVHRAVKSGKEVLHPALAFESDGVVRHVDVRVRPLREVGEDLRLFMVVFSDSVHPERGDPVRREDADVPSRDSIIQQLESELRDTREHLQSTIEEVKSSNEELLSMNEELQSANEELQTSKEELQSANEELETVNAELSRKLDELDRANSDLQNFFENTQTPTIFLDEAFRVKKFTPTANRIFRLIPADVGRSISDIAPVIEGEGLLADFQEVIRTLRPVEREVRTRDGGAWFIMRVNPYRTIANVISGVVVTFSDVSDLKAAEEQQRMLAAIVEGSNDAIIGRDLQGRITSWNRGAERLYGYSADEALGRPVRLILPYDREEELDRVIERVRAGEVVAGLGTERVRKDGQRIFVSLTVSPVRDHLGRIVGVSSISRDITDKRRMEEVQSRLAAIVESSDDAIISKDLNAVVTSWNQGAERLLGYTAAEMVGQPIFKIVPPDHREDVLGILATIRRGERVRHFETVRVRKDGRRVDVSLTVSPILDGQGRVIGASKIARDIGEKKAVQAELERSIRLRDEFITVASHELKTPLTSIKLQAQLLKRKLALAPDAALPPEQVAKLVDQTVRQINRLNHLVEDMLDVSRISLGKLSLRPEPVDLSDLAREVVESLGDHALSAGCQLETDLAPGVEGEWDRHRIEQVLINLLTNACRHAGGKQIRVSVRRRQDLAELEVQDRGGGIAEKDQARIFERFERAVTENDGGFGIGLYLVKEIATAHGGSVSLRSRLGEGSVFTVTLPLRPAGRGA